MQWTETNVLNALNPSTKLLTEGISPYHFSTAEEAISFFYKNNVTDEFIPATIIGESRPIAEGMAFSSLIFDRTELVS